MIFREINISDYDEACQFNLRHEDSFRDSSVLYVPDSEDQRKMKTDRIIEGVSSGRFYCLAVFSNDIMISALFQHKMEIDKVVACHIHGLWVDPAFRGKGIGAELKKRGEEWAISHGCVFMDSNVRVENTAMRELNEKLGYTVARLNFRKSLIKK